MIIKKMIATSRMTEARTSRAMPHPGTVADEALDIGVALTVERRTVVTSQ